MTALLLSAVGGTWWETRLFIEVRFCDRCLGRFGDTYVALSADHLVAIEFRGKGFEGGLNDAATKTEDKVKS